MRTFQKYEQGYALSRGKMERVMVLKEGDVWTQVVYVNRGHYLCTCKGRVKTGCILPLPSTNSWCGSV
jgi:hypothetical protein